MPAASSFPHGSAPTDLKIQIDRLSQFMDEVPSRRRRRTEEVSTNSPSSIKNTVAQQGDAPIDDQGDIKRTEAQPSPITLVPPTKNSPIAWLPTEALMRIFWIFCDFHASLAPPANQLSHVCTQWRDIVGEMPELWNEIDLRHPNFAALSLSRSKRGPVHISIPYDFMDRFKKMRTPQSDVDKMALIWRKALGPCLDRIGSLELYDDPRFVIPVLECLRGLTSMPLLSSLTVDTSHFGSFCTGNSRTIDSLCLPIKWDVRGPFPKLRRVILRNASIPKSSSIFQGLEVLILHQQRGSPGSTMADLLEALDNCPGLVSLDLSFCGPTIHPDIARYQPLRRIELNRLKTLNIYDDALEVGYILSQLNVPATTYITLKSRSTKFLWSRDLYRLVLPPSYPLPQLANPTWFKYTYDWNLESEFEFENIKLTLLLKLEDCADNDDDWYFHHAGTFLFPFLAHFSPKLVETIELYTTESQALRARDWAMFLSRFPALKGLYWAHSCEEPRVELELCRYLRREVDGVPMCPKLETLILSEMYFKGPGYDDLGAMVGDVDLGIHLVECLRAREARGCRLKTLKVVNAHELTSETAELLRGCAEDAEEIHSYEEPRFGSL